MNSRHVNDLLQEMEDWDKDKRFMAASDLTQEVTMSSQSLDLQLQKKVCQAFLKQLEDQSIDVQGNAVKCLAKIVCKFQEQQIGEVLAKLSQLVLDGKAEVRDIYATCLKGLLSELPSASSSLACQNVLPKMLHGITSHPAVEVKEECTDVFHDFLKRFGDNRVMQWSDQESMATSLLNLLKPKQCKSSLRKKVIACIGALSSVLADRQLDSLMRTLLSDVRSASTKDEKQKYIQCISTVSRNVGFRIGAHLKEIAPLFLQIVNQATEADAEMDGMAEADKDHEVVENCLNAFESFVLRCSKELSPHLDELCTLILSLIAYDPNFYATGEDDAAMEDAFDEFDDEVVDSDDDDSSWKVRRAALKVLAAMVKGLPDKLQEIYSKFAAPLIARFQEREENVKLDVFSTFAEMASAAVIQTQSSVSAPVMVTSASSGILEVERPSPPKERPAAAVLVSTLPNCVIQLNKQLRSKSLKTRQGALSLLRVLADCLPQHLEPNLNTIKDELVKCLKESNSSMRLDTLFAIRSLTDHYATASIYQQLAPTFCPLFLQCCNDSYYKSIAQSLRCIGVFVYPLRPTVDQASPQLSEMAPVLDVLRGKLTATDIDQEVKESALECFGHLAACVGDLPNFQSALQSCLPPFVERVKNEVTRSVAIKSLKTMCISKVQISALQSVLHALGGHLSSYLSQNSRAFRQQCLDALVHLMKKYGALMPKETRMQILGDIVPFITDSDLYITELCVQVADEILQTSDMAPAVIEKCIPAVLNVCRSPLLQGGALDSILNFLSRVAQHRAHCPFDKLRQELSDTSVVASAQAQAQRHIIGNLAKGLAAIVSSSAQDVQQKTVSHFLTVIQQCPSSATPAQVQQCELALLALGEIGKQLDLSTSGFCDTILRQLESSQDEIRLAAALALGYATVGAMATLLKVVIDNVQQAGATAKGQKTQYLLLTSLREVIAIGVAKKTPGDRSLSEHLKPHVPGVLPILSQYADSSEESVRNVVSESFGHLLMVDQDAVLAALAPLLSSRDGDTWKVRASAVSAIRFAAAKQCPAATIVPLKDSLLACLGDDQLQVRKSALQSVNVVCRSSSCGEILRAHTEMIFERLKEDTKQKPELIREVDLGPFKHKVDDGLPLRKIAYLVATSMLAAYPEQVVSPSLIDLVLQGLADNEDVQVICCQLLQDLCSWSFALFRIIGRIGDLIEPFDRCIMRCIKQVQAKQQVGRAMDMLRLYARTLKVVEPIAEANQHKAFADFMAKNMKDSVFQQVYDNASSGKDVL